MDEMYLIIVKLVKT